MTILSLDYYHPMKKSETLQRDVSIQGTSNKQTMSIGEDGNTVTTAATCTTNKNTFSAVAGTSKGASNMAAAKQQTRAGKRPGRKPSKINERDKLERSRQSARECRARKKLRYQYLEELVINREKAVFALRDELKMYKRWCSDVDEGEIPEELAEKISLETRRERESYSQQSTSSDDDLGVDIVCFSPYND